MENYKGEVWVSTPDSGDSIFSKGEVIDKVNDDSNLCKVKLLDSDALIDVDIKDLQKANPTRFDGYDDMASLTYLNEASVLNNLKLRYKDDKIYTHSGLFLVAVNPYKKINIYNSDFIKIYSSSNDLLDDGDNGSNQLDFENLKKPHIFGTAQNAFMNLIKENKDQSILVTGESGAGKTENTKKVIQYILSVSTNQNNKDNAVILENQILQANPILESFGNATTVRNLNSSRFGKFIKIQINAKNELSGAHIDWYLLEKSRVIFQDSKERNYHVFYQLLKGAPGDLLKKLLLDNTSIKDYEYLKNGLTSAVDNINDKQDFNDLLKAFKIMNFTELDIFNVFKVLSIILHLGNIQFKNLTNDSKQAVLLEQSENTIEKISTLLGVPSQEFKNSFLNSKIKIGREIVNQQRTANQAKFSLDALSKSLYEKLFQYLIDKINENFKSSENADDIFLESNNDKYVGILDIAGFEIFEKNSFEQLCINYTNEKLQQFFNHHMFELEQSEYMKEGISWNYIDFGNELKPTIELIEGSQANKKKTNIFSILDEECVVPKGTDKTFIDKLFKELENKDSKIDKATLPFKANKIRDGFIIKHYAGSVDYSVDGWLDKNKDPLSSTMVELLSNSQDIFTSELFNSNSLGFNVTDSPVKGSPRKKSGMFRTVAQRHKEQLTLLMDQLSKTYPHFVRCILPNSEKKPGMFVDKLVLHQLRCNGVLEGIRIARSGYPNRIDFKTFSNHYGILSNTAFSHKKSQSNNDYKYICEVVLDSLDLDPDVYKIGLTKLFFRNGVLASLEKKREEKLNLIFTQFNSIARGKLIRKDFQIKLQRLRASKVLLKNFQLYSKNDADPWFKLIKTLKPRLDDSGMVEVQYKTKINKLENKIKDLKTKIDEELSDREASDSKIQLLEMEISNNKDIIAKKDIEISSSRKTIVNLEKEMTEISESSAETSLILKEKDAKLQELSALNVDNVKKLEENCKELEKNCKEFEESNKKIKIKLESETKLISILKDEILSLKSSLDRKEMELTSLRREKRTRDSSVDEKISDLQSKLNEALNENKTTASDLRKKIELLDTNTGVLQSLQAEHKVTLEELNKLQEITKDYEAKKLAYDQAEKIKKKFKQLKHEFQQTKTLLDQKIKDEIEFNAGRQQYDKELEETKLVIKDLQKELEVEKRATVDLEIKLQHAALETERAIRNNKSLEMDNSQLKLRLRTNNPDQAMLNQYEINMKKSTLSPEVHELREEIRLLRTRLAAESYENRNLKAVIKKGGNSSVYLDNFKISGFNNNSKNQSDTDSSDNSNDIKIFNDHTETDSLKEKLVIEKEANKRLQNHYVKLQKDLMYYKSKYNNNRDSVESNVFGLLDSDSMEYKNKFQMSQIEINDLKEQIKDLRLQLRKNSKFLNNHGNNDTFKTENILNDSTNIENSIVNRAEDTKLKHENLRLSSALNELKTKLHRLELNNGSRFEQEEEIHQLKNNLKTIQLKNSALTSSVELYKGRSEDYYTKLSKAEVELQSSLRERNKLKDDISHLKEKLKRYEVQFDESDRQIQTLSDSIRDLEKQLSDKSFQIEQLTQSYDNLKEKYEDSEELRKSVKSVNHEYQESEIARLNNELTKSVNKETEMAKLMKNMNLQLETCRKEISTAKFNNNEMSREKKVLTKALNDCISKNEGLLGEVKENILKVQNLAQQANVLKVSNDDLLKERDNLLQSKRILEEKLNTITVQFDEHLSRVREDANNAVLVSQLSEKLEKSQHNLSVMNNSLNDLKNKYELVSDELEKVKGDYFQTVEENKELVKFNTSLTNRFNETEKKHEAELKAQDMHWSARINELDEKLFTAQSLQRQENHKYDSFTRTIKDLEIRNKDLERSKKHSEDEIKHLDATIDKLHQNYDSLNKREMEAQLRCKQLARECDKFRELLSLNSNI